MVVFTLMWLLLMCLGVVDTSTWGPLFAETMVYLTVISIISRWLPRASLASDFFLVTAWTPAWWMNGRSLPVDAVIGFNCCPFILCMMWAIGLHSLFVAQFALTTCLLIAVDPRQMGTVSRDLLICTVILVMPMIVTLEWQTVIHFNKLQKHMSVSTDGQMVVNRSNGIIVSVCGGAIELLGLDSVGAPFSRVVCEDDWDLVQRWCRQSTGEPSEVFLATLCSRASWESAPVQEFDARLIPYEVTGPDVHFCLQVVGEVRCHTEIKNMCSSETSSGAARPPSTSPFNIEASDQGVSKEVRPEPPSSCKEDDDDEEASRTSCAIASVVDDPAEPAGSPKANIGEPQTS